MVFLQAVANTPGQETSDRISITWRNTHCWGCAGVRYSLLLSPAATILCEHSLRLTTIGHPSGHDCCCHDAMDHCVEHEGEHGEHADWHWT